MMKFKYLLLVFILLTALLSGCNNESYSKYTYEFIGAFDTTIQIIGYSKSKEDFEIMSDYAYNRLMELHKLFDIYNYYDGVNNVKTINENAGIKPVKVQKEIIELLLLCKEWYYKTNGKCNVAMGSVLSIWHEYRNAGIQNPEQAQLPPLSKLQEAAKYTDIDKVIIDEENSTVFLEEKNMNLDVGAVAKGYSTELVVTELLEKGYDNFAISSGGNVRVTGRPQTSGRNKWGVGIQDPKGNVYDPDEPSLDIIYVNNKSVVTSGDYHRTYTVDGRKYHHLIDSETLMPAEYFSAVVVVDENSGFSDFMSTTLFLTPFEEGFELAEKFGIDVVWIFKDGTIKTTPQIKEMMKNLGGATGKE